MKMQTSFCGLGRAGHDHWSTRAHRTSPSPNSRCLATSPLVHDHRVGGRRDAEATSASASTTSVCPEQNFSANSPSLSETVVGPVNSHFGPQRQPTSRSALERARLKYEYREWLSVIVGKMHKPVNYWNDVYHHGRLFFPVIDRPALRPMLLGTSAHPHAGPSVAGTKHRQAQIRL